MNRRLWVLAACLLGTVMFLARASRAEELPVVEPLSRLPLALADWQGRNEPRFDAEIESVLGADDYLLRSYRRPDGLALGLYVGYYRSQRQGDTIHSPLNCLPGAGWQPLEVGRTMMRAPGSETDPGVESVEVNRVVIGKGLDRQLVYYWYQSHRRVVASEYWGKWYTVVDAVRDNRTDAALVRVTVPLPDPAAVAEADRAAADFIARLFPELYGYFPE